MIEKYMSRIYPTASDHPKMDKHPIVLTVWKKSSMNFQGTDGFMAFNREGRLVSRVDNYSRKNGFLSGVLLMDGAGKALLTLKPQMLRMQYQWNGFEGGDGCRKSPRNPAFSMRKRSKLLQSNDEAEVFIGGGSSHVIGKPDFRMEGCFRRRCCKIWGPTGEVVAEISRKKIQSTNILLSEDVFSLIVQPGYDCQLIMAFVIIMDRICRKPYTPILCS